MTLIRFCVRYPVTVIVGMILALLFGVIALVRLPIQMTPTVERPEISVETVYRGAAPQEVENEIVDRQEEKLISVQDLQELVSTSYEGRGMVTLRFDWGVNKDVARLEVSEKLDLVQDTPNDAERPVIRAVSSDEETPSPGSSSPPRVTSTKSDRRLRTPSSRASSGSRAWARCGCSAAKSAKCTCSWIIKP